MRLNDIRRLLVMFLLLIPHPSPFPSSPLHVLAFFSSPFPVLCLFWSFLSPFPYFSSHFSQSFSILFILYICSCFDDTIGSPSVCVCYFCLEVRHLKMGIVGYWLTVWALIWTSELIASHVRKRNTTCSSQQEGRRVGDTKDTLAATLIQYTYVVVAMATRPTRKKIVDGDK